VSPLCRITPKALTSVARILYTIENSIATIQSLGQKEKSKSILGSMFNPADTEVTQRILMEEFDGMASVLKSNFRKFVGFFPFIKCFFG
jgi:hypothetical protein